MTGKRRLSMPRAICPRCGLDYSIRKDGALRGHNRTRLTRYGRISEVCPGSGMAP